MKFSGTSFWGLMCVLLRTYFGQGNRTRSKKHAHQAPEKRIRNTFDLRSNPFHTSIVTSLKDRLAQERRLERRARRLSEYRRRIASLCDGRLGDHQGAQRGLRWCAPPMPPPLTEMLLVGERDWNVEAAKTSELYIRDHPAPLDLDAFLGHLRAAGSWGRWCRSSSTRGQSVNLFEAKATRNDPAFSSAPSWVECRRSCSSRHSSTVVQIPQWGLVPSLNLAVAGSIVVLLLPHQAPLELGASRPARRRVTRGSEPIYGASPVTSFLSP